MAYSRNGYAALIAESTENTPIKPTFFFGFNKFDVVTKWGVKSSNNIFADRNLMVNAIKNAVDAPVGKLSIEVEPKFVGYPLRAAFGAPVFGTWFPISGTSGTFQVGETVTGGTSAATATILEISNEGDYLVVGTVSGTFTAAGETITGGTSSATAALGVNAASVKANVFKTPISTASAQTYTLEIGYENEAIRLIGVRFPSFDSLTDKDNIIGATLGVFARSAFTSARVLATVATGSTKTILLDQTLGLTTADTIKVFRPSTGLYLDFSGSGVKTSSISSISPEVSITVGNVQTALAVGDLIVLAPQTPSYSVQREFAWIGGAVAKTGDTITAAIGATASMSSIETIDFVIANETQSVHAANATTVAGRFPSANFYKGFKATGKFKHTYKDPTFLDRLRNSTQTGLNVKYTAGLIGATTIPYTLDLRFANAVLGAYHPPVDTDSLLAEDVPLEFYRSAADGYTVKVVLLTDTSTSY